MHQRREPVASSRSVGVTVCNGAALGSGCGMSGGNGGVSCRPWIGRVREGKARAYGCRRRSARQRVCGEPPESARIPRKRPRPEGMAAGRRRLAAPQAMTITARGWGSPCRAGRLCISV